MNAESSSDGLAEIRDRLDRLVGRRLHGWTRVDEDEYSRLATREAELLGHLSAA